MKRIITIREFIYYYLDSEQHISILDVENSYPYFAGTVEDFYNDNTQVYHGAHIHHIEGRTNINHEQELLLYI